MAGIWPRPGLWLLLAGLFVRALAIWLPQRMAVTNARVIDEIKTNPYGARATVYQHRRGLETSLMAKGIFGTAASESQAMNEDV